MQAVSVFRKNTALTSLVIIGTVVAALFLTGPYEGLRSVFYIFYWSGTGFYELVYGTLLLLLMACLLGAKLKLSFSITNRLAYFVAGVLEISLFCKISLVLILFVRYGVVGNYLGGAPLLTIMLVAGLILVRYENCPLKSGFWKSLIGSFGGAFLLALIIAGSLNP